MKDQAFFTKHDAVLDEFVRMSQAAGARADYVQGGGGNTSAKLDDALMTIKASGFMLGQIEKDHAYAVLDYQRIRAFYAEKDPKVLEDVEAAGSRIAKEATVQIEGLAALRPSVEAGFHAMLKRFVLHSHSVYANMVCCCVQGREIAKKAFEGAPYSYGYVPYVNPGAMLTFTILEEAARVEEECGKYPSVIFMGNHGVIATDDDMQRCTDIHEDVNKRCAEAFGVSFADFPTIAVKKEGDCFASDTPWLKKTMAEEGYPIELFISNYLYPDQLVFLSGNVAVCGSADIGAQREKCLIVSDQNAIIYRCGETEALTIEQTFCALLFIARNIRAKGYTIQYMNDAGCDFISNWESEKYRKSLVQE